MATYIYTKWRWQHNMCMARMAGRNAHSCSWQRKGVEWTARYPKHPLCYCVTDVTNVTDVT